VPEAVQGQRQHRRRRPAGAHRPGLRRQVQRGDSREAGGRRNAMSATATAPPPQPLADERLAKISTTPRLLRRPQNGALLAAVVVAIFFWTQNSLFLKLDGISNWTDVASTIGIPAVVAALLMIGAQFCLSSVLTLRAATAVGFLNGYMVMRTKLPSFIVTLATFFILQGVNLGVTKAFTDQVSWRGLDTAGG